MPPLSQKVALVTGAGSGIGRATALALAKAGARLIVCDIDDEKLADIANSLGSSLLLAKHVDVSQRTDMSSFATEAHARTPAVDILVNNAGVGLGGTLLDTPLDDWDWVIDINLKGVIHGCHYFVPQMVNRGRGGHVVNIASVLGLYGAPGSIGYSTTKFGVVGLSESLRAELLEHNIAVTTICPGVIDTSIIANTRFHDAKHDREKLREKVQSTFTKRNYPPEKVAASILAAVSGNGGVRPVSPEAWTLYLLKRLIPNLLPTVGNAVRRATGLS